MPKYLCKVYSSSEYAELQYVYIEIDECLRRYVNEVLPTVKELAKKPSFRCIQFMDYSPECYEELPEEFSQYEDAVFDSHCVQLPDDTVAPEGAARLEYAVLEVELTRMRWVCRAKHSSYESETVEFRYADVFPEDT